SGADDFARIRVADRIDCDVRRVPHAFRDAFRELRRGIAGGSLDEEEVAELVHESAAVAEEPVDRGQLRDHVQLAQAGLLLDLAQCRLGRGLAALDVTLRQPPVRVRVADQEELHAVATAPEHDTAGTRLDAGRARTATASRTT